jgi:hypothetical protein
MTKNSRLSFIRSRAIALRVSSFALSTLGATGAQGGVSPSVAHSALSSLPSLPPIKSVHVWRKTARSDDAGEALPVGYIPAVIPAPFVPAIDKAIDAEVAPIAHEEALPEIGEHNLRHAVNCMLIALPWHG